MTMALETEGLNLDPEICRAGVTAVFDKPQLGQYFVCVVDNKTVGSLLIVNEWSDWRCGIVWWIHSVFIESEYRGFGLFKKFYLHIKNLSKEDSEVRGLRLYVDKTNHRAKEIYESLGMNNQHYELYEWMKL